MRRDRTGELIEDDDQPESGCSLRCTDGWLNDPTEADRPAPCPRCRPWLHRVTVDGVPRWTRKARP